MQLTFSKIVISKCAPPLDLEISKQKLVCVYNAILSIFLTLEK